MKMLSEKEYWSDKFSSKKLPRPHDITSYNNYRFDKIFKKKIPKNSHWKVLEIGAAHSSWLIYWNKEFGFKPVGVEYTQEGASSAKMNLEHFGIDGVIYEEDFFHKMAEFRKEKYNVIFSYGFIEHFDNYDTILKDMYELLEDDGIIVTVVPNIEGIWGGISKKLHPEVFNIHRVVSPSDFNDVYEQLKGSCQYNGFFGTFYLYVVGWQKRGVGNIIQVLHKVISKFLRMFGIEKESKKLSPYVLSIFKKER